jgi:hypothetical protein
MSINSPHTRIYPLLDLIRPGAITQHRTLLYSPLIKKQAKYVKQKQTINYCFFCIGIASILRTSKFIILHNLSYQIIVLIPQSYRADRDNLSFVG